jgi:hypothetical protein
MKTVILTILLITVMTLSASAAGGGGGGSTGSGATAPAGTIPVQPPQPGGVNRNQPPPTVGPYSPAITANGSNGIVTSNQFGMNSNRFQGSSNLAPTGAASGTNGPNSNFVIRDRAVTDSDQALLVTLRQEIETQLGTTSPESMLVHFFVNNGLVTVIGHVANAGDRERILLRIQQTAGVAQVVDRLHIGMPPANVQPQTAPAFVGVAGDHAFSAYDQGVLTHVRQTAAAQLGVINPNTSSVVTPPLPVHFSVQNGVVSVTGTVISEPQRQSLLTAIGRVPGVVRVVDNLQIGAASDFVPTPQSTPTNP